MATAPERHMSGPLTTANLAAALEYLRPTGGHIAISDGQRDAYFVFTMAGVRIVACGFPPPSLSHSLVLGGYVDQDQQEALAEARREGRDEREVLVDLGISPDSVREGARSLGVQLLLDCLFWPGARFEAGSGRPYYLERLKRDRVNERTLPTPLKNMLLEIHAALKAVGPARTAFPTLEIGLLTTGSEGARARQEETEDGVERHLLECLLSRPGLSGEELKDMLGCGEAAVMRRVQTLIEAKIVTAEPRPPGREAWEQRVATMRERLETQPINQLVLRLALAAGLQELEQPQEATRQLDSVGWLLFGQRRHDEALEAFNEALALTPNDLEALQGRVSALTALERGRAAAEAAVDLGERYLARGLPNQAKLALAQALASHPSPRAQELLVLAVDELGDRSLARELAETLIPDLRRTGRGKEADELAARYGFDQPGPEEPKSATLFAALAIVASLLCAGLALPTLTTFRQLEARQDVSHALKDLELGMRQERHWDELVALFPQEWEQRPGVEAQVQKVRAELAELAKDGQTVPSLRQYLIDQRAENAEDLAAELHRRIENASTDALREPLQAHCQEVEALVGKAKNESRRVAGLASSGMETAFAAARRLAKDFPNVPSALKPISLKVQIRSSPAGARVRWRGDSMQFRTPFDVEVPLVEKRKIELTLEGYEPYSAEINLLDLDSQRPVFELVPSDKERDE